MHLSRRVLLRVSLSFLEIKAQQSCPRRSTKQKSENWATTSMLVSFAQSLRESTGLSLHAIYSNISSATSMHEGCILVCTRSHQREACLAEQPVL